MRQDFSGPSHHENSSIDDLTAQKGKVLYLCSDGVGQVFTDPFLIFGDELQGLRLDDRKLLESSSLKERAFLLT